MSIANLGFLLKNRTQLLHREMLNFFCMRKAFNGPLDHFFMIQNMLIRTLNPKLSTRTYIIKTTCSYNKDWRKSAE